MHRIFLSLLWTAVFLFVAQVVYFVLFSTRPLKYNEGKPLAAERVLVDVGNTSCLYNDGNGNVWIGTEGSGVYRYEIAERRTTSIEVPDELKHASIRSLVVDCHGRLWVGTSQRGLFVRNDEQWKHYETGERIPNIQVSPIDGTIVLATNIGVIGYNAEKDVWMEIDSKVIQPTSLAFDSSGNLFVGTSCDGIVRLNRDDVGYFSVGQQITAPRRFGPDSAPTVSPVPLDPCGEGLPSNQINALLVGSDGTVWAGTSAGLAWSRDSSETWTFLRGRDYGDKMRGLFAGTPHGWKELPRLRFGDLLPEDHVSLLVEDESGTLWIGTSALGCIALKPSSFYRNTLPKNEDMQSQRTFLEEVAAESSRFHGTKTDRIVAMTQLSGSEVLIASVAGLLEKMECHGAQQEFLVATQPEKTPPKDVFPVSYVAKAEKTTSATSKVVFLGEDRTTMDQWFGKYGKTYALIGGGEMPHDKLIAFDESVCQVRPFVGNVGNRTRPLERVTLSSPHHHHEDKELDHSREPVLTGWSSIGNTVPRTADGQHLWCEVKLNQPGQYELSLYFVDPASVGEQAKETRDYLIEIFPEMPTPKVRIPRHDWQELGKQTDEWATHSQPLAHCRINDFQGGVYSRFALVGPGTYLVKIDKNYGYQVDLCAILIDKIDADDLTELPLMSGDQSADDIP